MKQKNTIFQILTCNKVLYNMYEQHKVFNASLGFKIFKLMKIFDEVEEYVFDLMEKTFENINLSNMNDEQMLFYQSIITSEVELEYEKIDISFFENNENLMLTLEDIDNIQIILNKNK